MAIQKILGFLRDEQDIKPYWNRTEVKETLRIISDDATDTGFEIIYYLPSYVSGPGTTDFNPMQATFTIYRSSHPTATDLVLLEAYSVRRVPNTGNAWDITLLYGSYIPNELVAYGTNFPPSSSGGNSNPPPAPSFNPLSAPPVWSSSSAIVQKQTMTKPNGNFIVHEHGKLLNDPITYEEVHTTHTWTFNVDYHQLNYVQQIAKFAGIVGAAGNIFGEPAQRWKMTACSGQEARESYGSGDQRVSYHYVKVSLSIEYNPSGWVDDAKLISRSTLQLLDGDFIPIDINGNGDRAHEPWPLLPVDGGGDVLGAPYDALNPNAFAVLDTGYPVTGNLIGLINAYSLEIP